MGNHEQLLSLEVQAKELPKISTSIAAANHVVRSTCTVHIAQKKLLWLNI